MRMKFNAAATLSVAAVMAAVGLAKDPPAARAQEAPARGEARVEAFERIRVEGPLRVTVDVGPRHALAPEDPAAVRATVAGGELIVTSSSTGGSRPHVAISLPSLRALTVAADGQATVQGLDSDGEVSFTVLNGGEITASGLAERVKVEIRGAGRADLASLKTESASAKVEGSGWARVFASRALSASVAGDGSVEYTGSPANVAQAVSGPGVVRPF